MTTEDRIKEIARKSEVEDMVFESYRQTLEDNTVPREIAKDFCIRCLAIV